MSNIVKKVRGLGFWAAWGAVGVTLGACSENVDPPDQDDSTGLEFNAPQGETGGSNGASRSREPPESGGRNEQGNSLGANAAGGKEWTFALYLASETLDDLEALDDLNALERRYHDLEPFMDIVALTDGFFAAPELGYPATTQILHIRADGSERLVSRVVPPEGTEIARLLAANDDELFLSSPEVLKAFLEYVQDYYPSRHLAVNIHDHGGAWQGAVHDFVGDDFSNQVGPMRLAQFRDVFSSLAKPIDVLGFEACLMQELSTNTFWHLSTPSVKYVVASEQIQLIPGWIMDNVARRFVDRHRQEGALSPLAFATEIVNAFDDETRAPNPTLSLVDLASWPDVLRDLDQLGAALVAAGAMSNPRVGSVVNELVHRPYGDSTSNGASRPDLVDVSDFCQLLEQTFGPDAPLSKAAVALRSAVEHAVVLNKARMEVSTGLSVYLPNGSVSSELSFAAFEKQSGAFLEQVPNWQAFLRSL